MMISDEEARLAAACLKDDVRQDASIPPSPPSRPDLSPGLLARIARAMERLPELRVEKVERARGLLRGDTPSANEVAAKLLGREVSDSLR